ncbi:MAG: flagellar basal body-associated FliL family protein [Beijerinckiaceae bacterium]|nr:flagellar basal body-associated FliL family protein [Beijerinckiaceae bacterium]
MINPEVAALAAPGAGGQPSLVIWLAVMAVLTLCAAAAGAGLGLSFGNAVPRGPPAGAKEAAAASATQYGGDTALQELPPVITNLAGEEAPWVRVQASIVFDRKDLPKPAAAAAEIGEDILALLRTLSLAQISGASGLQHLREDLNERAAVRSGGLVRELILQSVVVQ